YKAVQTGSKYNMVITLDHLELLVLSDLDDILKDPKVTLFKDGDKEYTENERANLIQQAVSSTYQMLEAYEVEEDRHIQALRFNAKLYIDEWCKEEYGKTLIALDTILREGRKYNGVEDANAYHVKKYDLIRTLRDGDVERLSDVIDTSRDNVEDIKKKLEEESYEVVAKTGVNEFDKNYPLSKGEMLVIQGG